MTSTERLYQIEHPRLVAQFDAVCDDSPDEPGFWLSKVWLKGTSAFAQSLCNVSLICPQTGDYRSPKCIRHSKEMHLPMPPSTSGMSCANMVSYHLCPQHVGAYLLK